MAQQTDSGGTPKAKPTANDYSTQLSQLNAKSAAATKATKKKKSAANDYSTQLSALNAKATAKTGVVPEQIRERKATPRPVVKQQLPEQLEQRRSSLLNNEPAPTWQSKTQWRDIVADFESKEKYPANDFSTSLDNLRAIKPPAQAWAVKDNPVDYTDYLPGGPGWRGLTDVASDIPLSMPTAEDRYRSETGQTHTETREAAPPTQITIPSYSFPVIGKGAEGIVQSPAITATIPTITIPRVTSATDWYDEFERRRGILENHPLVLSGEVKFGDFGKLMMGLIPPESPFFENAILNASRMGGMLNSGEFDEVAGVLNDNIGQSLGRYGVWNPETGSTIAGDSTSFWDRLAAPTIAIYNEGPNLLGMGMMSAANVLINGSGGIPIIGGVGAKLGEGLMSLLVVGGGIEDYLFRTPIEDFFPGTKTSTQGIKEMGMLSGADSLSLLTRFGGNLYEAMEARIAEVDAVKRSGIPPAEESAAQFWQSAVQNITGAWYDSRTVQMQASRSYVKENVIMPAIEQMRNGAVSPDFPQFMIDSANARIKFLEELYESDSLLIIGDSDARSTYVNDLITGSKTAMDEINRAYIGYEMALGMPSDTRTDRSQRDFVMAIAAQLYAKNMQFLTQNPVAATDMYITTNQQWLDVIRPSLLFDVVPLAMKSANAWFLPGGTKAIKDAAKVAGMTEDAISALSEAEKIAFGGELGAAIDATKLGRKGPKGVANTLVRSSTSAAAKSSFHFIPAMVGIFQNISSVADARAIIEAMSDSKKFLSGIGGDGTIPWRSESLRTATHNGADKLFFNMSPFQRKQVQSAFKHFQRIIPEFLEGSQALSDPSGPFNAHLLYQELMNAVRTASSREFGSATDYANLPFGSARARAVTGKPQIEILDLTGKVIRRDVAFDIKAALSMATDINKAIEGGNIFKRDPLQFVGNIMRKAWSVPFIGYNPANLIQQAMNPLVLSITDGVSVWDRKRFGRLGSLQDISDHTTRLYGAPDPSSRGILDSDFYEYVGGGKGKDRTWKDRLINPLAPAYKGIEEGMGARFKYDATTKFIQQYGRDVLDSIVVPELQALGIAPDLAKRAIDAFFDEAYMNGTRAGMRAANDVINGVSTRITLSNIDPQWPAYMHPTDAAKINNIIREATSVDDAVAKLDVAFFDANKAWEQTLMGGPVDASRASFARTNKTQNLADVRARMNDAIKQGGNKAEIEAQFKEVVAAYDEATTYLSGLMTGVRSSTIPGASRVVYSVWKNMRDAEALIHGQLDDLALKINLAGGKELWATEYWPKANELWSEYGKAMKKTAEDARTAMSSGDISAFPSAIDIISGGALHTDDYLRGVLELEPGNGFIDETFPIVRDAGRALEGNQHNNFLSIAEASGADPVRIFDEMVSAEKDVRIAGADVRARLDRVLDDVLKEIKKTKDKRLIEQYFTARNKAWREYFGTYVVERWNAASREIVASVAPDPDKWLKNFAITGQNITSGAATNIANDIRTVLKDAYPSATGAAVPDVGKVIDFVDDGAVVAEVFEIPDTAGTLTYRYTAADGTKKTFKDVDIQDFDLDTGTIIVGTESIPAKSLLSVVGQSGRKRATVWSASTSASWAAAGTKLTDAKAAAQAVADAAQRTTVGFDNAVINALRKKLREIDPDLEKILFKKATPAAPAAPVVAPAAVAAAAPTAAAAITKLDTPGLSRDFNIAYQKAALSIQEIGDSYFTLVDGSRAKGPNPLKASIDTVGEILQVDGNLLDAMVIKEWHKRDGTLLWTNPNIVAAPSSPAVIPVPSTASVSNVITKLSEVDNKYMPLLLETAHRVAMDLAKKEADIANMTSSARSVAAAIQRHMDSFDESYKNVAQNIRDGLNASNAAPNTVSPNPRMAAAYSLDRMDTLKNSIYNKLRSADAFGGNVGGDKIMSGVGLKAQDYFGTRVQDLWDKVLYGANVAGDKARSFTMVDFWNKTRVDDVLQLVFPFPFWRTRDIKNSFRRFAGAPGFLYHTERVKQEIDRNWRKKQNLPSRLRTYTKIPDVIAEPLSGFLGAIFPIAGMKVDTSFYVRMTPDRFVPTLATYLFNDYGYSLNGDAPSFLNLVNTGVDVGLNPIPPISEGLQYFGTEEGSRNVRISDWTTQTRAMVWTGIRVASPDQWKGMPNWLKPDWMEHTIGREVENMMARGDLSTKIGGFAQDYLAQAFQGLEPLPEWDMLSDADRAKVMLALEVASDSAASKQQVSAISSISSGFPVQVYSEAETGTNALVATRNDMYYDPKTNPLGSDEAAWQFTADSPAIQGADFKRAITNPAKTRPGVTAVNDMFNKDKIAQEKATTGVMNTAVDLAITADSKITKSEMNKAKAAALLKYAAPLLPKAVITAFLAGEEDGEKTGNWYGVLQLLDTALAEKYPSAYTDKSTVNSTIPGTPKAEMAAALAHGSPWSQTDNPENVAAYQDALTNIPSPKNPDMLRKAYRTDVIYLVKDLFPYPDYDKVGAKGYYAGVEKADLQRATKLAGMLDISIEEAAEMLKQFDQRYMSDPEIARRDEIDAQSYRGGGGGGGWTNYYRNYGRSGYRSYGGYSSYGGGGGGYGGGGGSGSGESDLLPSIESYIGKVRRLSGALWSTPQSRYSVG